jgi:predicted AAA+ superfamily ATPase
MLYHYMNVPKELSEISLSDHQAIAASRLDACLTGPQGRNRERAQVDELRRSVSSFMQGSRDRMVLLPGLRGTGKTTMLAQVYDWLRRQHLPNLRFYYFSADELWQTYGMTLGELFARIESSHGEVFEGIEGMKTVILLDEVQYSPDWALDMKILYDRSIRVMVIASGSSAMELMSEGDLSRRASVLNVAPLDLAEYALLRRGTSLQEEVREELRSALLHSADAGQCFSQLGKIRHHLESFIAEMGPNERDRFIRYGSMPCSIDAAEESRGHAASIRILEKVIGHDLPRMGRFDLQTLDKTWALLMLLSRSGRLSYDKLSQMLMMSKVTLAALLQSLRQVGVLTRVMPHGSEYGRQARTPMYTFSTPALRAAVLWRSGGMTTSPSASGALLEDASYASMERLFAGHQIAGYGFDPSQGGADIIVRTADGRPVPIEVGRGRKDSTQVRKSMGNTGASFGVVASSVELAIDGEIVFIPWEWLLLL